ncbi:MAG: AMIN domain-containing protein [bacterium]
MKLFQKMLGCGLVAFMAFFLPGANCGKNQQSGPTSALSGSAVVKKVSVPAPDRVKITGNDKMDADTIFLTEEPPTLSLEIKGATLAEGVAGNIPGKGSISSVSVESIPNMAVPLVRVMVELNRDMTYSLKEDADGVTLNLTPQPEWASGPETLPYNESREEVGRQIRGEPAPAIKKSSRAPSGYRSIRTGERPKAPFLPDMPSPASDGNATVIGDVYFRTLEENDVQVMIYTNGPVKEYCDFNLLDPPRIVVDLWQVMPQTPKETYSFNWGRIKTVRVGEHMDKSRVVIDIKGKLPAYQVETTYTGVVITIFNHDYYREVKSDQGECLPGYPCDRAYEADLARFKDYRTAKGESFRSMAESEYGNPDKWLTIFTANREIFTKKERKAIKESNGALELGQGLKIKVPLR